MSKAFALLTELHLGSLGWTDVSTDVDGAVSISRGVPAEGSRANAGKCGLRLNNMSGRYSPRDPAGEFYGKLVRNTPLRVGVPVAADGFGVDVADGWGADWSVAGAASTQFHVAGGLGVHEHPTINVMRVTYRARSWRDCEQVTDASIAAVATGASVVVGHVHRYQTASGDCYWLRMEFNTGGTLTLKISRWTGGSLTEIASTTVSGGTYTAGQSWTFRSAASGSFLAVKAWPAGSAEPADWQLTAADDTLPTAGRPGLASWVVAGNTNTSEVSFDNWQALFRRFYGEVPEWPPGFNLKGNVRWVDIEAAGIIRRLEQGDPPEHSALRRTLAAAEPAAYWPGEDGLSARRLASEIPAHPAMTVTGPAKFVEVADEVGSAVVLRYGSAALVDLSGGGQMAATVPADVTAATATEWTVSAYGDVDPSVIAGDFVLLEWETSGGTYVRWQIVVTALDSKVIGYTSGGTPTTLFTGGLPIGLASWSVSAIVSGGTVTVTYRAEIDYLTSFAGSLGGVTAVEVNPTGQTASDQVTVGHVTVWPTDDPPPAAGDTETDGYGEVVQTPKLAARYEAATDRMARLCAEDGVPLHIGAEPGPLRMGWQPVGTLLDLLDQCAATDGGYLYESRDRLGLAYRTRHSLYNQTPVPIAWTGQLHPPFAPQPSGDFVRNDVEVQRIDGASARVQLTSGPLSVQQPPDGAGQYRTRPRLSMGDDTRLYDQAGWRLNLGTVDRDRYPALSVQLAAPGWQADPDGLAAIAAVDTGDVLEVTGAPSWAAGDIRTMVTGYSETIDEFLWEITFAGVPAQPWDVAEVDGDARVGGEGSALATGLSQSSMSLLLSSTLARGPWTEDPADLPFPVRVGEEQVTASAIAPVAPDGFDRTLSNTWGAVPSGEVWTTVGGAAADYAVAGGSGRHVHPSAGVLHQSLITPGGSRNFTITIDAQVPVMPSGASITVWAVVRASDTSNYYVAQLVVAPGGSTSLLWFKRVGGALTVIGSAASVGTHTSGAWWRISAAVFGTSLHAKAWIPASMSEPDWQAVVNDASIASGTQVGVLSRLESGNTNAKPVTIFFDNFAVLSPQRVTLSERGVNGIQRAWSAGTPVAPWLPARAAL